MYCQSCGTQLQDANVRFCSSCGSQVARPALQGHVSSATSDVSIVKAKLKPSESNRMPMIIGGTVLVLLIGGITAAVLLTNSLKSQLVGTWSEDALSKSMGLGPSAAAETWRFRSDNTCSVSTATRRGQGKYTILDDGSIKIEIEGGGTVTGRLTNEKLIINYGKEQTVLYKQ